MRGLLLAVAVAGCSPAAVKVPEKPSSAPDPAVFAGGSLPLAEHGGKPVPADVPVVSVQTGSVRLNDAVVDDAENVRREHRSTPLVNALRDTRKAWIEHHPDAPFPGVVVYRLDRTTRSRLVTRLLFAAGLAGYPYGCIVAMTGGSVPTCVELGLEIPDPPPEAPKPKKLHMRILAPDRYRLETGEVVSRAALRATIAARDHHGYELVLETGDDLDLQSLVASAETLGTLVPPASGVNLAPP
jgi:hypothetical protein